MAARKVLISPGFGAGWSTWIGRDHEQEEFALFHPGLIAAIESGDQVQIDGNLAAFAREFKEKFGEEPYLGGARDLEVESVDGQFSVEEYDGSESLRFRDSEGWH